MKTMNMISRRSFLKAAMAASAVSALALTGCGGAASSASTSTAASSEAASSAVAGETFKVGIVNYVDHASLNQIVASVESRLDELGKEKGVTFDYADYYANAQADQSNLNQIGADLVADGVDVIVAVATPTAATMLAAVEDTEIPVVYSAVTDPAAAGFDGGENMTGTSDALNTAAIMNLILAADPEIDTIGLLYDLSQDSSTQAIADAKAFCDEKGIQYIEKNGTTTAEVQMAAEAPGGCRGQGRVHPHRQHHHDRGAVHLRDLHRGRRDALHRCRQLCPERCLRGLRRGLRPAGRGHRRHGG